MSSLVAAISPSLYNNLMSSSASSHLSIAELDWALSLIESQEKSRSSNAAFFATQHDSTNNDREASGTKSPRSVKSVVEESKLKNAHNSSVGSVSSNSSATNAPSALSLLFAQWLAQNSSEAFLKDAIHSVHGSGNSATHQDDIRTPDGARKRGGTTTNRRSVLDEDENGNASGLQLQVTLEPPTSPNKQDAKNLAASPSRLIRLAGLGMGQKTPNSPPVNSDSPSPSATPPPNADSPLVKAGAADWATERERKLSADGKHASSFPVKEAEALEASAEGAALHSPTRHRPEFTTSAEGLAQAVAQSPPPTARVSMKLALTDSMTIVVPISLDNVDNAALLTPNSHQTSSLLLSPGWSSTSPPPNTNAASSTSTSPSTISSPVTSAPSSAASSPSQGPSRSAASPGSSPLREARSLTALHKRSNSGEAKAQQNYLTLFVNPNAESASPTQTPLSPTQTNLSPLSLAQATLQSPPRSPKSAGRKIVRTAPPASALASPATAVAAIPVSVLSPVPAPASPISSPRTSPRGSPRGSPSMPIVALPTAAAAATVVVATAVEPKVQSIPPSATPSPVPSPPKKVYNIPAFYFPHDNCSRGPPLTPKTREKHLDSIHSHFAKSNGRVNIEQLFQLTTSLCQLPSYVNGTFYAKLRQRELVKEALQAEKKTSDDKVMQEKFKDLLQQDSAILLEAASTISQATFIEFWTRALLNADTVLRFFRIFLPLDWNTFHYRYYGSGQGLTRDDFRIFVREIVDRHPGLEFLESTPEFQEKYSETVIARIFYTVNTAGNEKMSVKELRNSNLLEIITTLDSEEDINKINDYFSYEHFYVCYCKFWLCDTDHDGYIDVNDLQRYEDYALTRRIIERVMQGKGRKNLSPTEGTMNYLDFIVFFISEVDKSSAVSIDYWFNVMDLDSDGLLTAFELEYFFEEQRQRMQALSQEKITFTDILCQLVDMIKRPRGGTFTVRSTAASTPQQQEPRKPNGSTSATAQRFTPTKVQLFPSLASTNDSFSPPSLFNRTSEVVRHPTLATFCRLSSEPLDNFSMHETTFTREDLKSSGLAPLFFNILFNLNKFILAEQRDPIRIRHIHETPELSDWDRYAIATYYRLAECDLEAEQREQLDQEQLQHTLQQKVDALAQERSAEEATTEGEPEQEGEQDMAAAVSTQPRSLDSVIRGPDGEDGEAESDEEFDASGQAKQLRSPSRFDFQNAWENPK